jgi:hypothetical protein
MCITRLLLALSLVFFASGCMVPMPDRSPQKSGTTYGPMTYKPYTYQPVEGTSGTRARGSSTWYHSDGSTSRAR